MTNERRPKSYEPETVGDALALAHETQVKLKQAEEILATLTDAGVRKPAILGALVEPTMKIRNTLQQELAALNELAESLEGDSA